ncbi:ABC-type transporter Mla subunit MlaD [Mycobacterium sp. BK086]|uniref:MlaD family protein n=1 Tax=Mycobacterium sp. BK086 TaxID=2512165 RepID=UPI00105CD198|nr:MCE family protein [Mycobacterium sp. BK086]TDO08196.1 ABC-type transporter Mla subunit MlaD [Mycobacterium sp. BK086]
MANSLDLDGRGPSERQLLVCGLAVLLVAALVTTLLLLKSNGKLTNYVRVVADLLNVGDGLPQKSDVKYHGVLVGAVDNVIPAANGHPNYVHIDLKPEYAGSIPASVTARVVPSNVFAVSSVQLVSDGTGPAIQAGEHIPEDTALPTVLFQTTISKLRDVLAATGRGREDRSVGILAAVNAATENRRGKLLTSGAQLNRLLDQLNSVVSTDDGPSTVSALIDATHGLADTAPDLVDALHQAVQPMQVLAEKRSALTALVTGGAHTMGTTHTAINNHIDQLTGISHDLTPVLGSLAMNAGKFVPAFTKLNVLSRKFFDEVWMPELDTGNMRVNLSLTPSTDYTRADCPRYGQLLGNSCYTAPKIVMRPDLPEMLLPQNYQPPKDLAPTPGTVVGPDGNLVAVGPPLVNPNPNLADPNPPTPWWAPPFPPVPLSANPDDALPPPAPPAAPPPLPAEAGGS